MTHAPTFVDFFAGIGGFRVGLELAGWRCAWSVEMEPFCRRIYEARFGHAPQGGMIQDVEAGRIPQADLWCGGFPCQGLSVAGKRGGLDDPRSGLFWEWMRLVEAAGCLGRPRWLLIENVPGLLSSNGGEDFGLVLAALVHLGYGVAWRVLDARYFGVAQRRRRLFIVGHLDGEHPPTLFLEPEGGRRDTEAGGQEGPDVARSVTTGSGGVSGKEQQETFVVAEDVAHTLTSEGHDAGEDGTGRGTPLVAPTLQGSGAGTSRPGGPKLGAEDEYLILSDDQDEPLQQQRPDDGGADALAGAIALNPHTTPKTSVEIAHTLHQPSPSGGGWPQAVAQAYEGFDDAVCDPFLAGEGGCTGFSTLAGEEADPDGVREAPGLPGRVDLSVRGFGNRPACRCADSPRYRALGNAVAVPVITWIGRRLREEMGR